MEVLFENKFTRNKEWAKEIYKKTIFCRPLTVFSYALFSIPFLVGIYEIFAESVIYIDRFIALPFYLGFIVILYFSSVKSTLKRDLEMHGKLVETTICVTDEKIEHKNSMGTEYNLNYSDIKKVWKTKKYILLVSKNKLAYSFKRDGFSIGDEKGFLDFLRSKGVKFRQ